MYSTRKVFAASVADQVARYHQQLEVINMIEVLHELLKPCPIMHVTTEVGLRREWFLQQ